MAIDFSAPKNARTYSGREAHDSWAAAMGGLVDPSGCDVVDVGCGGGIYTRGWLTLGAASVTGVDASASILAAAADEADDGRATFVLGDASATGLPENCADVVFSRALVHHLQDVSAFAAEAVRIARPGGRIIIQDRTMEDVAQPPSAQHIRGYFLDHVPRLAEVERIRRPDAQGMVQALRATGSSRVESHQLWEVRAIHETRDNLLADIRARKGRSILHELDDDELESLIAHLEHELPSSSIQETDRWTLWTAQL